jgi:hypothetical protein
VPGVSVSGTLALSPSANPVDGRQVQATLTVTAAGMPAESLRAAWTTDGAGAQAQVSASAKKHTFAGTMPAP